MFPFFVHKHTEITYCAFCKTPHNYFLKKHISLINIFSSLLGAYAFTEFIWQKPHMMFILIALLFISINEFAIRLRRRLSLICRECGFDPVLYLKSQDEASLKVIQFLEKRKADPLQIFEYPLQIPKKKVSSRKQKFQSARSDINP